MAEKTKSATAPTKTRPSAVSLRFEEANHPQAVSAEIRARIHTTYTQTPGEISNARGDD